MVTMARQCLNLRSWVFPFLLMLLPQIIFVVVNIFYKLASSNAMSPSVLMAYRFIFGAISLAPFAIHKWWRNRANLTWKLACLTFLYGLIGGSLYHNLYLQSLRLTSATFATAIFNLNPVVTFILATILRLEPLPHRTAAGRFKISGVILSTGGVALLTFYQRIQINCPIKFDLLSHFKHETKETHNLMLGLILAIIATFCNASGLIIQAKIEDNSENIFLIAFLMNVMAAIPAIIYALCVEKNWAQWKLGWDIRLWAAFFGGVVGSGLNTTIITFCVSKMGPLFVSSFSPLGLVLMVAFGPLLLNEKIYLTSLIAIVLIIVAIMMLLWGKLKEENANAEQSHEFESAEQSHDSEGV